MVHSPRNIWYKVIQDGVRRADIAAHRSGWEREKHHQCRGNYIILLRRVANVLYVQAMLYLCASKSEDTYVTWNIQQYISVALPFTTSFDFVAAAAFRRSESSRPGPRIDLVSPCIRPRSRNSHLK